MRISPQRTEIAKARMSAGILQKEFADRLGCSISHIQKIETGRHPMTKPVAQKASAILGVKIR